MNPEAVSYLESRRLLEVAPHRTGHRDHIGHRALLNPKSSGHVEISFATIAHDSSSLSNSDIRSAKAKLEGRQAYELSRGTIHSDYGGDRDVR